MEILDEVRVLISDPNYGRYNEINRAIGKIAKLTKFNWLRRTSTELIQFKASDTTYTLDMRGIRRLESLWVYGVDSSQQYWHLMEEVTPQLFEDHVKNSVKPDGTLDEDRPKVWKIEGGPVATITVNPAPESNYTVRVNYIEHPPKLEANDVCPVPSAYTDVVAELASGMILMRSPDPAKMQYGQYLIMEAQSQFEDLVADSHPNRTIHIDRVETAWMK